LNTSRKRRIGAFSLLELLITAILVSILLGAIGVILSSHLRLTDSQTSVIQSRRESARLNYMLNAESLEACAFNSSTNPASCSQTCSTTASNDLRLRVPVIVSGTTAGTRFIRYYLNGSELRRDGPAIQPNGQLDLSQTTTIDSLLIDSVNAFTVTLDSDCHTASITLRLSFPDSTSLFTTRMSLRTNVEAVSQ